MSRSIRFAMAMAMAASSIVTAFAVPQTATPAPAAKPPAPGEPAPAKQPVPATAITTWFAQLDVPAEAIARGQTGVVSVKLDVDDKGNVAACTAIESSGWTLIDATACAAVKARAKFQPAQDAAGKAIPASIIVPRIRYTIKEGQSLISVANGKRTIFNRTIRVAIDKAGIVTSCVSLNADMQPATACADYPVGKPAPQGAVNKPGIAHTLTLSLTAVSDYDDAPAPAAQPKPAAAK